MLSTVIKRTGMGLEVAGAEGNPSPTLGRQE